VSGARRLAGGVRADGDRGFAPHRHLDHDDLSHLIQTAAVFLLYRGGLARAAVTPAMP
jgi:hypothetical protein